MWKQQENSTVLSLHADWFASGIGKISVLQLNQYDLIAEGEKRRWKAKVSPSTLTNMLMVLILELGIENLFRWFPLGLASGQLDKGRNIFTIV